MAKKHDSGVSKKGFPGLIRIKDENGNKVWRYKGKNFNSLKELDMVTNPTKYVKMNFNPKTEFNPVLDDVTTTNDFVEIDENKDAE